jgi:hypothetical protein
VAPPLSNHVSWGILSPSLPSSLRWPSPLALSEAAWRTDWRDPRLPEWLRTDHPTWAWLGCVPDWTSDSVEDTVHAVAKAATVAMRHLAPRGTLLLQLRQVWVQPMAELVWWLSSAFDQVWIVKPSVSRATSSDRYLIGKGFRAKPREWPEAFVDWVTAPPSTTEWVHSVLAQPVPCHFATKLDECNEMLGQQQLEAQGQVIAWCHSWSRDDKLAHWKRAHLARSYSWCQKHNLHTHSMEQWTQWIDTHPLSSFEQETLDLTERDSPTWPWSDPSSPASEDSQNELLDALLRPDSPSRLIHPLLFPRSYSPVDHALNALLDSLLCPSSLSLLDTHRPEEKRNEA